MGARGPPSCHHMARQQRDIWCNVICVKNKEMYFLLRSHARGRPRGARGPTSCHHVAHQQQDARASPMGAADGSPNYLFN
jgi:hypothetical protein